MEEMQLSAIAEELRELNKNLKDFSDMLENKMGGFGYDNFNVTLYTDQPIKVSNVDEEK